MTWLLALAGLLTVAVPLAVLYRPLGDYMAEVFTSDRHWKVERGLYRLIGVDPDGQQTWQAYLRAVLVFSGVGLVLLYLMERLQPYLPYSLGLPAMPPDLAFNTAASFVGNTNWQAYSPEQTVGYTVQMAGLAVQSFVSAAAGIAVSMALVRGIAGRRRKTIGNFWVDVTRANLRLLLPLSVVAAIIFLAGGVVQNLAGFQEISTVAGGGQLVPGGPLASQEAIKMLGTNGGGFYNANSAHPFENPTPWTNLFQVFLLLVIPFALPRTFGTMVKDKRLGHAVVTTMAGLFVIVYAAITAFEVAGRGTAPQLAGAAMEGKEQRFGILGSTLFATATTGTSGGAANSTHDSYTAFGGVTEMLNMALGEITPGGVGAGLYTILVLVIIAVFLTGLLLGRAPLMCGKRIGLREMKIASLAILALPTLALGGLALTLGIPPVRDKILNEAMSSAGPHGLSELIYAFISASINNGSAFGGLGANSVWLNVTLGLIILLGRFVIIAMVLALAGSLAAQDQAPAAAAELPLHTPQFVVGLMALIVYLALPTLLPILMAGPLAEGFG